MRQTYDCYDPPQHAAVSFTEAGRGSVPFRLEAVSAVHVSCKLIITTRSLERFEYSSPPNSSIFSPWDESLDRHWRRTGKEHCPERRPSMQGRPGTVRDKRVGGEDDGATGLVVTGLVTVTVAGEVDGEWPCFLVDLVDVGETFDHRR